VTQILADALTPIFAGLLLGYIAGLRGAIDNKHVQTLITYVMSFAIPASLFLQIARTPRAALREQIPIAVVVLLVYAVVYGMSYVWSRKKDKLRPSDSSVVALTMGFPNAAAVGLPLLASVFGSEAIVAVATALAIGSITVSPITLAILEAERNGQGFSPGRLGVSLAHSLKKPIVWAPLLAVAVSVAGITFPSYVERSLAVIGSSAEGSALVLTGLVVSAQRFEFRVSTLFSVFLKNAFQPALALAVAMLIHLSLPQTRYVTLISALPCGFFGVVFGKDFGSSPVAASSGLIASYALGIATLAVWIAILNHLQ
jgi:malonate transporter and related proteins